MKIVRNFENIGTVGTNIKKNSEILKQEKEKIQKYINEISSYYHGKDSDAIINNFIKATNKIDIITQNLDYYGNYMVNLAIYDRDNLEAAVSTFNQINSDISTTKENIVENVFDTKLNLKDTISKNELKNIINDKFMED